MTAKTGTKTAAAIQPLSLLTSLLDAPAVVVFLPAPLLSVSAHLVPLAQLTARLKFSDWL